MLIIVFIFFVQGFEFKFNFDTFRFAFWLCSKSCVVIDALYRSFIYVDNAMALVALSWRMSQAYRLAFLLSSPRFVFPIGFSPYLTLFSQQLSQSRSRFI